MSWLDRLRRSIHVPESDPWLSFHRRCIDSDGREREAALRLLPSLPVELQGRAVPLLLARLNDWVPQVRRAAARALPPLLRDELELHWLAALPAVVTLMSGSRWAQDGGGVTAAIEDFLLRVPARRAALLARAPEFGLRVRRWLATQSWQYGTDDEKLQALLLALRGTDALLARQALQMLQERTDDWPTLPGVSAALAQAHFPALRLAALRHEQSRGRLLTDREAVDLALSRHGTTRGWVLFHASAVLKGQIRQHAEMLIGDKVDVGRQLIALQVLRGLQAPTLPGLLASARVHPAARLREAGFTLSLSVGDAEERESLAASALADPSRRVQRAALTALRRGEVSLTARQLLELLLHHPTAAQPVLRALALQAAFARASAALHVLAEYSLNAELAGDELRSVVRAMACSMYAPTPAESTAIRQAVTRLGERRSELLDAVPEIFLRAGGVDSLLGGDARRLHF